MEEGSRATSSKLESFMELVTELHAEGHRALVFSQFTGLLALVRERLDATTLEHLYLDGSTPAKRRAELVERWQTGDAPLFLISLKAGGTGLNLTAADYVLHLDPWWNPAVEDQASDRAHRIGQDKPVTVVRFVSQGTIEQAVLELHEQKRALAEGLLASDGGVTRFSPEELMALLESDGDVERDEDVAASRPAVACVVPAKKGAKTTKRGTTRTSPRARAINTRTAQGRQEYDRAVLEAVRSFDHPASAAELRELTGGTPLQLRASLSRLGTEGLVTCRGNARGTRYRAT